MSCQKKVLRFEGRCVFEFGRDRIRVVHSTLVEMGHARWLWYDKWIKCGNFVWFTSSCDPRWPGMNPFIPAYSDRNRCLRILKGISFGYLVVLVTKALFDNFLKDWDVFRRTWVDVTPLLNHNATCGSLKRENDLSTYNSSKQFRLWHDFDVKDSVSMSWSPHFSIILTATIGYWAIAILDMKVNDKIMQRGLPQVYSMSPRVLSRLWVLANTPLKHSCRPCLRGMRVIHGRVTNIIIGWYNECSSDEYSDRISEWVSVGVLEWVR